MAWHISSHQLLGAEQPLLPLQPTAPLLAPACRTSRPPTFPCPAWGPSWRPCGAAAYMAAASTCYGVRPSGHSTACAVARCIQRSAACTATTPACQHHAAALPRCTGATTSRLAAQKAWPEIATPCPMSQLSGCSSASPPYPALPCRQLSLAVPQPFPDLASAGFPVERLVRRECIAAFFGLGAHWGSARSQNAQGHVVSTLPALQPAAHAMPCYRPRLRGGASRAGQAPLGGMLRCCTCQPARSAAKNCATSKK